MPKSYLSGGIGIPEGVGKLLSRPEENAVQNLIQNEINILNIVEDQPDGGGGGGAVLQPSATIESNATIRVSHENITSCTLEATGVYVITHAAFETDGTNPLVVPVATPESQVIEDTEATTRDFLGLSSVSFDHKDLGIVRNTIGELWVPDEDHDPVVSSTTDRIAILNPEINLWSYLDLDAVEGNTIPLNHVYPTKGTRIFHDSTNNLMYVTCEDDTAAKVGTLIFDSISRTLLMETWTDLGPGGATQFFFVIGIDPANNRILMRRNSDLAIYNATAGIPTTVIDNIADVHQSDLPNITPWVDNGGSIWYSKDATNWRRITVSGGAESGEDVSKTTAGGADGSYAGPPAFNPNTNKAYYMSSSLEYLMVLDCTAKTVARVNSVGYAALVLGNRHSTLEEITTIQWSADYSVLIAMRGGSGNINDILVVNPSTGAVVTGLALPDLYSINYGVSTIVVTAGKVYTVGSNRIQEVGFVGDIDITVDLTERPVFIDARMISTTQTLVQTWDSQNSTVRKNSAFHIQWQRTQ